MHQVYRKEQVSCIQKVYWKVGSVGVCVCGSLSVKDKEGDIHTSIVLTIKGQ